MNRKVYTKPSIAVVTMTSTPLLAAVSAGGQYDNTIKYGGSLNGIDKYEDEPELTETNGTKWYIAE
jgi:hypothetical protein